MKVAIISGSVYGTAEEVARHAETKLKAAGYQAWHAARATLQDLEGFAPQALLAVTSTTGMGELPDNLMPLYSSLRDSLPGGEQLRELFAELGVREVQPMLQLDASETVTPETDAEPWLAELADALKG